MLENNCGTSSSHNEKNSKARGIKLFAAIMTIAFLLSFIALMTVMSSEGVQENAFLFMEKEADAIGELTPLNYNYTNEGILSTVDVIKKAKPSVVSIQVTVEQRAFNRVYEGTSVGTGFIISEDGYIVTNNHVVEGGKRITVTLNTGEEYEARLIGGDELSDIAVIKINATGLPTVELGDSDALEEGEDVVAIGTPGGIEFAGTTTKGIVSALDRNIEVSVSSDPRRGTKQMTVIQTDASINSGNSGGPLLNNKGQVIGINTLKLSRGYEGMGFAIPINGALPIINELIEKGEITEYGEDPYVSGSAALGIVAADITIEESRTNNVPTGIKIEGFTNENLTDVGLRVGDIIIKYNDHRVETIDELKKKLANSRIGETVTLTVYRNGDEFEFGVRLVYSS